MFLFPLFSPLLLWCVPKGYLFSLFWSTEAQTAGIVKVTQVMTQNEAIPRSSDLWPCCDSTLPLFNFRSLESVQFSHSVVSDSLWPHELQLARPPCPSPTPGVHSNSHPSSRWCHPAILSSVIPFSSCPQSLPASESFPMSQLFAWNSLLYFFLIYLFIYLFLTALGLRYCTQSISSFSEQASHCSVFFCCGAQALGAWASVVVASGL